MKNRILVCCFVALIFGGCVPYSHEIKPITKSEFVEFDKFDVKDIKILINAIEKFKLNKGSYPEIESGRKYVISKTFKSEYIKDDSFIDNFSYENHQNFYKVMSDRQMFLSPHTDHRQFDLTSFLISNLTLGIIRICQYENHYCHSKLDQGRLIYYGGETSKIPPSQIHLNKSEEKLGTTQEKKLQEILSCNKQIFLPENQQQNTDKCYRGWYNEIIEN